MPITFVLEVKQEHLDKGKICNAEKCAIALALLEQFPDITEVYVDSCCIDVHVANILYSGFPDSDLEKYISSFDEGVELEPKKFELEFFKYE